MNGCFMLSHPECIMGGQEQANKRVRAIFLQGRSGKSEGVEEKAVARNSEREEGWERVDESAEML